MSAWIVSKTHIDRIVNTAVTWLELDPKDATALGRTLWTENLKSVKARYPNDRSGDRPGPTGLTDKEIEDYQPDAAMPFTPAEMLKAIRCLDYQSCEHDGWCTSAAYAALVELTAEATRRGADSHSVEYDRAPWGFDDN